MIYMYYSINIASLMLYNADCSWCIHVYTVLYCNDVHACVGNARTGYCTVFLVLYICFDLVRKPSHIMVMYLLHQMLMFT